MTNFDRWQLLMRNCTSPQSFIDFGYYFLIAAALQRRVWFNSAVPDTDHGALFINPYYCLVSPPGVGKGAVTRMVAGMLRSHRYEKGTLIKTSTGTEKPPLFPLAPDSTTFEQLLASIAVSIRRVPLPTGSYFHCTTAFVLEELDSIFKHKTADVAKFLKIAYDCAPFDYETKHQGIFRLRNLCVDFIAGTQPDFLFEARKNGLFGQGFASRALLIFETQRRFSRFHTTELEPDQISARDEINQWITRLANIYGRITYSEATREYLEYWETSVNSIEEQQCAPRMQDYYARKKVTMLKLAAAMHFSESAELEIQLDTFKRAIERLKPIEERLNHGLGGVGRNPVHSFTTKIFDFVKSRKEGVADTEIILHFHSDMDMKECRECIEVLETTGRIRSKLNQNNKKIFYI